MAAPAFCLAAFLLTTISIFEIWMLSISRKISFSNAGLRLGFRSFRRAVQ